MLLASDSRWLTFEHFNLYCKSFHESVWCFPFTTPFNLPFNQFHQMSTCMMPRLELFSEGSCLLCQEKIFLHRKLIYKWMACSLNTAERADRSDMGHFVMWEWNSRETVVHVQTSLPFTASAQRGKPQFLYINVHCVQLPEPWHHVTRCPRPRWCAAPSCSLIRRAWAEWAQTLWPGYVGTSCWWAPSQPPCRIKHRQTSAIPCPVFHTVSD